MEAYAQPAQPRNRSNPSVVMFSKGL